MSGNDYRRKHGKLRMGADKFLALPISYFPLCSRTKRIFLGCVKEVINVWSSGEICRVNTRFESRSSFSL
jgi:hypothetical protein